MVDEKAYEMVGEWPEMVKKRLRMAGKPPGNRHEMVRNLVKNYQETVKNGRKWP